MTEREKMEQGLWYDANYDEPLAKLRTAAKELCRRLSLTPLAEAEEYARILRELLPNMGHDVSILAPFLVDYGVNCYIGDHSFINHGAYLMDCAPIRLGSHCFIGPNCGMYTAIHPLLAAERNTGLEKCAPIVIGDNVWIGGNVTILPGVTIGEGSVIGAGSVVTRNVPAGVIAVGNPCRVLREVSENDSIYKE